MCWPEIFGLSTFPVFWTFWNFGLRNWAERKQGFRTSETFAKITENFPENKVQNHCPKLLENFEYDV